MDSIDPLDRFRGLVTPDSTQYRVDPFNSLGALEFAIFHGRCCLPLTFDTMTLKT